MKIHGAVALVTGASRGMGRHYVTQLQQRGAASVYATARNPQHVDLPGAQVLQLDTTDLDSVEAAARVASDVTLLINNAGVSTAGRLLTDDLQAVRQQLDTNVLGLLNVLRAFAPVLKDNGGGAVLNVLSALSWFAYDQQGAYAASKAAAWSVTNTVRLELAAQGTQVTALHVGAVDTDMTADYDGPKVDPADVVRQALNGIESDSMEVVADEFTAHVKAALAGAPEIFYGALVDH